MVSQDFWGHDLWCPSFLVGQSLLRMFGSGSSLLRLRCLARKSGTADAGSGPIGGRWRHRGQSADALAELSEGKAIATHPHSQQPPVWICCGSIEFLCSSLFTTWKHGRYGFVTSSIWIHSGLCSIHDPCESTDALSRHDSSFGAASLFCTLFGLDHCDLFANPALLHGGRSSFSFLALCAYHRMANAKPVWLFHMLPRFSDVDKQIFGCIKTHSTHSGCSKSHVWQIATAPPINTWHSLFQESALWKIAAASMAGAAHWMLFLEV